MSREDEPSALSFKHVVINIGLLMIFYTPKSEVLLGRPIMRKDSQIGGGFACTSKSEGFGSFNDYFVLQNRRF